jgi:hypothetical protein
MKIIFALLMVVALFTLSAIPCHAETYYFNPLPYWLTQYIVNVDMGLFREACYRAGIPVPHPVVTHFVWRVPSGDVYIWDEESP